MVDIEEGDNPSYPEDPDYKMLEDYFYRSFLGFHLAHVDGDLHFGREELFQYGLVKTYLNSLLARFVGLLVAGVCQISYSINSL